MSAALDTGGAQLIPAGEGVASYVKKGQVVKVINTYGKQVIDTWAFNPDDMKECMSMEHTRATTLKLIPTVGDTFVSNHRVPMFTIVEDTTPGAHDTLIAACDIYRYRLLGGLKALGKSAFETPSPLNLFMNIPVDENNLISFQPSVSDRGQYISLRAETDLIVAFSACPQDIVPINHMKVTDAHFSISESQDY